MSEKIRLKREIIVFWGWRKKITLLWAQHPTPPSIASHPSRDFHFLSLVFLKWKILSHADQLDDENEKKTFSSSWSEQMCECLWSNFQRHDFNFKFQFASRAKNNETYKDFPRETHQSNTCQRDASFHLFTRVITQHTRHVPVVKLNRVFGLSHGGKKTFAPGGLRCPCEFTNNINEECSPQEVFLFCLHHRSPIESKVTSHQPFKLQNEAKLVLKRSQIWIAVGGLLVSSARVLCPMTFSTTVNRHI